MSHRRWPSPGKVGLSKIVARWVEPFLYEAPAGVEDRSSRPKTSPCWSGSPRKLPRCAAGG
ncbi:hypothetical protein CN171_34560 [Sinorhizobium meliloti]|nr:hypothetical protein CN171_34560 [Sinorhizobium meliloti]